MVRRETLYQVVLAGSETLFRAGPFNNKTLGEDHDLWKTILSLGPGR